MGKRENTFRIDFSVIPKTPSYEDVHKFIGLKLGLNRENVLLIQPNRRSGCVYVEVTDLELAQRIVDENDGKHEVTFEGKGFKIPIVMEDGAIEVRLYDLTRSITNNQVTSFLEAYGEVLSVRDLLWDEKFLFAGTPTGVRVARMIVLRNIPSSVVIGSETTSLSYKGQRQTCVHCGELMHTGIPCVQNKKLLVQKLTADQMSYANVTKLRAQPKPKAATKPPSKQVTTNPSASGTKSNALSQTAPMPSTSGQCAAQPVKQTKMPPPAVPVPEPANTDGNESDISASSVCSRKLRRERHPSKKVRTEKEGIESGPEFEIST